MPEYHSYCGSAKDPTLKHVVEGNCIVNYTKSFGFFSELFGPWKRGNVFVITEETEILDERVDGAGNGWLTLQDGERRATFFVYRHVAEFISEVKRKCF